MQTPKTDRTRAAGQPTTTQHFIARLCLAVLLATVLQATPAQAGVTVITHGWQPSFASYPTWVDSMAEAVTNAANARGLKSSWYHLHVTAGVFTGLDATMSLHSTATADETPEIVLTVDWSDVADHNWLTGQTVTTADVASWISGGLRTTYPSIGSPEPLAARPLHLIGHSRGGSVVLETARLLGAFGIWVDHVTTLDPHPLAFPDAGVYPFGLHFGDPAARLYENVIFADNYWRADSIEVDFDGQSIAGSAEVHLDESTLVGGGLLEHLKVHTWYHGTIGVDGVFPTSDGEVNPIPTSWYTDPHPFRNLSGFCYSRIANGQLLYRPFLSRAIGTLFGGRHVRETTSRAGGTQWANIGFIQLPGVPGNNVPRGQ